MLCACTSFLLAASPQAASTAIASALVGTLAASVGAILVEVALMKPGRKLLTVKLDRGAFGLSPAIGGSRNGFPMADMQTDITDNSAFSTVIRRRRTLSDLDPAFSRCWHGIAPADVHVLRTS